MVPGILLKVRGSSHDTDKGILRRCMVEDAGTHNQAGQRNAVRNLESISSNL